MIDVVYAMGSENVNMPTGATIPVQKGTHWPASDPVVRARPDLFTTDVRYGLMYTAAPEGYNAELAPIEVEQATANPGERRSARRS